MAPRKTKGAGGIPDVKEMIKILKSLYSPDKLREIVAGLGLPADNQTDCSGCNCKCENKEEK